MDSVTTTEDVPYLEFLRRRTFSELIRTYKMTTGAGSFLGTWLPLPFGFTVRPYQLGRDARLFTRLYNSCFSEVSDFRPLNVSQMQLIESEHNFSPELLPLLYEKDGKAIGFARGVASRTHECWIEAIGVLPKWRRQGLGRFLLLSLMHLLSIRKPTSKLVLRVQADNRGARELYRSVGFIECECEIRMRSYVSCGPVAVLVCHDER
jgi:ribosomal protein S18 acetylase RimI-like enzyme